ncbi:aminopeptidase P family protein [Ovoidimarina sediminis]|uniref:aminopeptidase P family protein n=1 Tax=Ovoidimarina sediminis TaxID=3079856 RepID=UPI00290C79C9|nr:aminopeptidase P family protein [Rhodophyticola sp. MJ-SS7]MDU8944906.1 aminopeptidase P family protein [Rhodophyticola sp. MJ-SS7]
MFQSFEATSTPEQGPPRLKALRAAMKTQQVDGFLIPRSDAHQGEYVAPCDDRLSWLTGFTGSAGFSVVLADEAGIFIDGRYRTQVKHQVDTGHFTPVNWPETKLADWVSERLGDEAILAFDPWLHTIDEVEKLSEALEKKGIEAAYWENIVDEIWEDRPNRPTGAITAYPEELAGRSLTEKCDLVAEQLKAAGQSAAILTLPDSIAWLLNIRGSDIPRIPILQAFAIIHATGMVDLFTDAPADQAVRTHLAPRVALHPYDGLLDHLETLEGAIRVDPKTAPLKIWSHLKAREGLTNGAVRPVKGDDPCILPKAQKTEAEIAATTEAHLRDGAAMVAFLAWLDDAAPKGGITEIDVVERLEGFRRATNALHDISFDTICGAGPNGAIVHYRVTRDTNREITPGDLLLVDSGGQYLDGTTDITRTVTTGTPAEDQKAAFTRVLQGMIAVSRARWPRGLAGRDLDALARAPLWMAGQDYDHGTGHGVGVFLSVHEGPQRLSRLSEVALAPGMILSNEPGYYREGHWGIRIENLVAVETAPEIAGGDGRDQLAFGTLTWVPIDTRLVNTDWLSPGDRDWLNAYHADVLEKIGPRLSDDATRDWLKRACRAI